MNGYIDTDVVFDKLTKTLGFMAIEVTGRKVWETGDETIPKVDGEFISIDLSSAEQNDWQSNEIYDDNGNAIVTHNYQVTYTLTAYRGKAHVALTKLLQSFNLPWIYDKYFPVGSPFAYSSSSTVSRIRVPLNMQTFENRAVVILTFNVCFAIVDTGAFEDLQKVNMQATYWFDGPTPA